ncbi:1-phosphatidylinositol 4,5-bisphosphate phosphodiesterase delta-1 [Coemansia aciculifera]|nr:1-phosphatidylinositol 4,5-bisphosphate phosphodiesterase delta-1 [Coemansia aciculifera]
MTDRLQHHHHRDIHHQLGEESRAILRHRCSHGSLNSSTSSTTSSSADPRPQTNSGDTSSEPEHDALTCLSCTRRNVISVFPRFRKVTTHLFSSLSRGHQSRAAVGGGCPTESCIRAVAEGMGDGDPHARDLPASQVYPAQPTGAALCLGKWGLHSAASATNSNTIGSGGSSNRPADRVSHGDQFAIHLPTIPGRLARGCSLLKTTSHGAHTREFCLDVAQQRITWDSRKKKKLAHIDLERIVEIRVGERALWAVANEDCLPHGAKRLFAIVYYHQMVLKTICVVAQSDESYHEWLDTLTNLLSSRQSITSLAHFRRWRLVCIYRQWWEVRQSGESATDLFYFVESMFHPAGTAVEPTPHPSLLSKAPPVDDVQISLPLKASARKWLSGGGGGPIRPTPSLPLPMTTTPPMLGRSAEFSLKPQHSSAISLTSSSLQSRCSDESFMELVDALRLEHAQQSIEALYHDISLSLMGFSSLFADNSVSQCQVPSLSVSDNENENDADDDDESDQLTMAGSSGNGVKRSHPPLRLALPLRNTLGFTLAMFARFLREIQKEPVSDAETKRRFVAFTRPGQEVMTAYELEAYLLSAFNSVDYTPSDDATSTVSRQDKSCSNMDMPLNQYYISTSHNTYLIGDQIVGTSKVEGYVRALLRGCRCIEVDCWDGGYGEPVVSHGHTLTTRILFEDVIIAVSHYAFKVSPYPVILSFETHCSLPQQARMATILKKHLGAMLVVAPVGGEQEYELPSPNQLKYRIIVKNKVLATSTSSSNTHSSRPSSLIGSLSGSTAVAIAAAAVLNSSAIPPQLGAAKGVSPRSSVAQLKHKIAPELSELIVYCKAMHFEGFEEGSEMEPAFDRVTSVSESTSNQQIRQHPKKYIEYNATQMTRVYPAFSRVTSTNFNPIGHWAAGCQLVALNFQTHDRNMLMYEAMFRRTRDFGYVLKPKHLREPASQTTSQASEDDGNESKASPASSSSPSSVSLQSSSEREAGVCSPSSLARCKTLHISVLSAYNATRGGPRRATAATRTLGPMERRSSFVLEAGGISRTSTWQMADPLSSSPKPLSRSPSDLAMFSFDSETGSLAAVAASDGDQLQQHLAGGYPSLNAAATAAMASLAAEQQKYALAEQQGGSAAGSVVRVEIEWITEGAVSGAAGGTGSSAEDVALLASAISHLGHQQQQQQLTGAGFSAIQSLGGTAPSSPVANLLGNGYPFHQTSFLCGSNLAATPKPALPMAPPTFTPAGCPAVGRGGSGSGRFVSRNGTLTGNSEVRWKDESLFRVVPEPELSFARLSLFEDDVEVASACISVDALKEGYRFIELGQDEKSRLCRPVYLLLHVQVSQLHCLATPPAVRI